MKSLNIVIIGVGGQGTLLASRILGALASELHYDVKVSEVHGMSQRGGSVVTYVRLGDKVNTPLVGLGEADYLLAFEKLEALRALSYLKKDGVMIVNDQQIDPMPVITGQAVYPEDVLKRLKEKCELISLDALQIAEEAGEARAVNLVLMGVLCARLHGDIKVWEKAVASCVPEKLLRVNLAAFEAGFRFRQAL